MILVINILNDIIIYGVYLERELICTFTSNRLNGTTTFEYSIFIESILSKYKIKTGDIKGCCISSVVPSSLSTITRCINDLFNLNPLVVGHGIKTGVNIRIDNHSQLGSDLVANACRSLTISDGPCIVIDFGIATTLSVINDRKEFIGVVIAPGVSLAVNALSTSTASLPDISVTIPRKLIGKNTIDSMLSGSIYGTACMIDGLIDRIEEEIGLYNFSLIATGVYAENIIPFCKRNISIYPYLTLEGLKDIYYLNKG